MTSDEVRRITERRNEAAAAMDACELEEAHRDDTYGSCGSSASIVTDPKMTRANPHPYSPYGFGRSYY